MKKTILFAMLGIVLAGTALESCKKGEGDPAISFRSRKGRMAGDWKLESGTRTDIQGSNTTTYTYTATTVSDGTNTTNYTLEYKIEKDGTFTSTEIQTGTGYSITVTNTGRWNFTGKIGDFKNKDHAIFYIDSEVTVNVVGNNSTTSTETYTGDQNSMVIELNTLKNKELVTKTDYHHSNTSGASSSVSEMHFAQ